MMNGNDKPAKPEGKNNLAKVKAIIVSSFIFALVLQLSSYILCGYFCVAKINIFNATDPFLQFLIAIEICCILLLVSHYLQIIIHEAGHLVFGLISGYGFLSFRVRSFMLKKEGSRLKIKKYSVPGTGGQCLMSPPKPFREEFPVLLYNLGGVIANLLFSLVFGSLSLAFAENAILASVMFCFAILNLSTALNNGIPMITRIPNDGMNVILFSRIKEAKRTFWTGLELFKELSDGKRLRDMPDEWFVKTLDDGATALTGTLAFSRAVDMLDFETAVKYGTVLFDKAKGVLSLSAGAVACDLIYCELVGENRREYVTELINDKSVKKYLRATKQTPSTIRVRYAFALLHNNNKPVAKMQLLEFEKAAKRHPYAGEIEGERELLELARQKYEERQAAEETE